MDKSSYATYDNLINISYKIVEIMMLMHRVAQI